MTATRMPWWPILGVAVVLAALVIATLRPYAWNPSAFFHLDKQTADLRGVPPGFVVLNVPGYDGEQYYEIARSMPLLFNHAKWEDLTTPTTIAYSYQRFLLPLAAFTLSLGHEAALPYTFLFIEL